MSQNTHSSPTAFSSLPFRQIHLDFHTSEHIPDIGGQFDPDSFAETLAAAHVNSVTLFAKCHHGWCYYPTKRGAAHPNLTRPDLLGDMIAACAKRGIQTPIYLTVQWDERTARLHPDWQVVSKIEDPNKADPTWTPVSLANDELVDHICELGREIVERYHPPGIFADILLGWEDVSSGAQKRMAARWLDPESRNDRIQNDREIVLDFCENFSAATQGIDPNIRLFFNSGHIFKNERERYERFSHLELESLPTGGWGYDHFPISARYAATLGKPFLGMTGKFHNWWGDFGGYKQPAALEYECCLMAALGARCSIGDQLHPSGSIDPNTYASIAPAYERIEQLEPFLENATPVSEIAIFSTEGHFSRGAKNANDPHDAGAARMLLESQLMFDVIDEHCDFSPYRLIILPDRITLDEGNLLDRFKDFLANGGNLICSGQSGMQPDVSAFALPFPATVHGQSPFNREYIQIDSSLDSRLPDSPIIAYSHGMNVRSNGAEVKGRIFEPYFNRTPEHFCSHQQTPYRTDPSSTRHGILNTENTFYFSHPIFQEYRNSGQPLTKYALIGAIKKLLGELPSSSNLPSPARLSLMRQAEKNRDILHLLYAQPQCRGDSVSGAHGTTSIQIIEDITPLHEIEATVALKEKPHSVYSAYDNSPITHSFANGRLSINVPKLYIHEAIVIEYS